MKFECAAFGWALMAKCSYRISWRLVSYFETWNRDTYIQTSCNLTFL